jgi:hypothetical protein
MLCRPAPEKAHGPLARHRANTILQRGSKRMANLWTEFAGHECEALDRGERNLKPLILLAGCNFRKANAYVLPGV